MDDLYQNRLGGANVGDVFQIGADDVFQLRYLAIGGLQKLAGALAILPNTLKGVDCDRNGIFIKLKSAGGLSVDSNGLYLTTAVSGAWSTPDFSAGNFTANGSMTWTVEAGDVTTYAYVIIGKTMTVSFAIDTSTIGGTVNTTLYIAIPNAETAKKTVYVPCLLTDNELPVTGRACVTASGTTIAITRLDGANYTAKTNLVNARGQITFEIN
ncbi:MAG: hypothetical protein WCY05_07710 [Candidatus Omnitrophota bacterium]